jgi:hypothetical protein
LNEHGHCKVTGPAIAVGEKKHTQNNNYITIEETRVMAISFGRPKRKRNAGIMMIKIVFLAGISFVSVRVFFLNSRIPSSMADITPLIGSLESFMNHSVSFSTAMATVNVVQKKSTSSSEDYFGNLPQWMQDYFTWHSKQRSMLNPNNWKDKKYLILSCRRRNQCGGLSDRLKPIPLIILIANRTKRLFMIHWDKPANLEEFIMPNQANWSVPDWMIEKIDNKEVDSSNRRGSKALIKLGTEKTVAVFTQLQDFHGGSFIYDQLITETFNETSTTDRYHLIYHDLFRYLFKPSPPVSKLIDEQMNKHHLLPGEYSISHYRAFYAVEHQKEVVSEDSLKKNAISIANCGSVLRPGEFNK